MCYCRKCLRLCKNSKSKIKLEDKMRIFADYPWRIICTLVVPTILMNLFMLYARKCKSDSVRTFSCPRVRKYENPKDLLTVPNGCSHTDFRSVNSFAFALVKASTSSEYWSYSPRTMVRYGVAGEHFSFAGQVAQTVRLRYLSHVLFAFLCLDFVNVCPCGQR